MVSFFTVLLEAGGLHSPTLHPGLRTPKVESPAKVRLPMGGLARLEGRVETRLLVGLWSLFCVILQGADCF
jgi:hypothetical protein